MIQNIKQLQFYFDVCDLWTCHVTAKQIQQFKRLISPGQGYVLHVLFSVLKQKMRQQIPRNEGLTKE